MWHKMCNTSNVLKNDDKVAIRVSNEVMMWPVVIV